MDYKNKYFKCIIETYGYAGLRVKDYLSIKG